MNDLAINGDKRMTVKEVAAALGTAESTIRNIAAEVLPNHVKNGITTFFDEWQVSLIKNAIVPRDLTLKSKLESTNTELEMMILDMKVSEWKNRRIAELTKKNDILQIENEELKPKAAFFDQVTNSKDAIEMKDAAKVLNIPGMGRNNLFQFLRDQSILMDNNTPLQAYVDRGYFRVIEQKYVKPDGDVCINLKTVVYQKGLDFIRREIKKASK